MSNSGTQPADLEPEVRSTSENRILVVPGATTGSSERAARDNLAVPTTAADDWADSRYGTGLERPGDVESGVHHSALVRTFAFVDLSGFTKFTREHGPHAAVELLAEFRAETRSIAALRGVRVAKWLGDGAMLVSVEPGPTVALGAELAARYADGPVELRIGIATGEALLFEGDDYVGEPVNIAAKLCAAAEPGELLADVDEDNLPEWVTIDAAVDVDIRSVGRLGGIHRLRSAA